MRAGIAMLVLAILAATLTGCGTSSPADPWAGLTHPDVLAKAGLKYYWNAPSFLPPGEFARKVFRLDENVYLLTDANRLVAIDAASGSFKWARQVAKPSDVVFAPVHAEAAISEQMPGIKDIPAQGTIKIVCVNTLSNVLVINRTTGQMLRQGGDIQISGAAANTAGATDGSLYIVGMTTGQYQCFRLQDGAKLWTKSTTNKPDPISAPICVSAGRVYVTNEGGELVCTTVKKDASMEWSTHMGGAVTAPFHVDERGVFVPSWDNRVYAFNAASGRPLWEPFICGGRLVDPIQVGESSVFQYARNDQFYVLDLATGRLRWSMREGRQVLAAMNGDVLIRDRDNNLLVVDQMLGMKKTSLPLTGHQLFVSNATLPAIYTAKADGRVFCITPATMLHLGDVITPAAPKLPGPETPTSAPAAPAPAP